jgi:hypothetical protein
VVQLVDDIYPWIDRVLLATALILRLWALIDCVIRRAAAFPAVNKLTKIAWLLILFIGGALGSLPFFGGPLNLISSASVVAALVYLFDVRPAVREISGGHGR